LIVATPPSIDPLALIRNLPCVSTVLDTVSTLGIGPVTELLESAAYLPLTREGNRFSIATHEALGGGLAARNGTGDAIAQEHLRVHAIAEDAAPVPDCPSPSIPLDPRRSQRVQVSNAEVRFRGAGATAFRAFGTGRTYPGQGSTSASQGVPFAAVLDLITTEGQLSGLAGTVTSSGILYPDGRVEGTSIARIMDPDGGLLSPQPLPPAIGSTATGVTYLAFLGEIDPEHPVTLRLSLTEGFLGSNVFELLRPANLGCTVDGAGCLQSHSSTGPLAGTVAARLSFDPITLCAVSGVQTREGIFTFHDRAGRQTGTLAADMVDGRAFRTFLDGRLLPFFRFGGSGPISGSTGIFAGACGIMMLNAVISVQPRTLSNLYVFRLEDPQGRYRSQAQEAWS